MESSLLNAAVILIAALVLFEAGRIFHYFLKAHQAAKRAVRGNRELAHAPFRILIIGDSTSLGTGCEDGTRTLAGRLAQDFPSAHIRNVSENAASIRYMRGVLRRINDADAPYDLVFIHAGGIDTIACMPLWILKRQMRDILMSAKRLSRGEVILVSSGDVGAAPLFRFPLNWLYQHRTDAIQNCFRQLAKEEQVRYVDLHSPEKRAPFLKSPERYYAPDLIHPNAEGYGIWYKHIKAAIQDKLQ